MSLYLDAMVRDHCETVRRWRRDYRQCLRTPMLLTPEMQADFYDTEVCDRRSPHRYFALRESPTVFVGMGGITNIQWENGLGEISLFIDPRRLGQGYGEQAVALLLAEAFDRLRLLTVVGECYLSNDFAPFWVKVTERYGGTTTTLPRRKWWNGRLYDALYFSIPAPAKAVEIHPPAPESVASDVAALLPNGLP